MTNEHVDWERIGRMLDERIRDKLHGNDEPVHVVLAEVAVRLTGIEKNTGALAAHQEVANHRIEKLEHGAIKAEGVHEERQRWLEKTADDQERKINNLFKWMAAGLTAAGVLSGIVFGLSDRLLN